MLYSFYLSGSTPAAPPDVGFLGVDAGWWPLVVENEKAFIASWVQVSPSDAVQVDLPGTIEIEESDFFPLYVEPERAFVLSWAQSAPSEPTSLLQPPPAGGDLGIGGHFQRPPQTTESAWVTNYCNGRTPDVNSDFQHRNVANAANDWSYLTTTNYGGQWDEWASWLAARPTRRLDVALGLCPWPTNCAGSSCGTNGQLLADVAAGIHDSKFIAWATWMRDLGLGGSAGRPIYIRLGWEMDGNFFPWGCGRTNTTLQDNYAAAFRRAVDAIRSVSGTNFRMVWCPNDPPWVSNDLAWLNRVYPGNAHVDVIAMDTYDRNTGHYTLGSAETTTTRQLSWTNWTKKALDNMAAFAASKGKPMAIGEFCCHWDAPVQGDGNDNGGGDNPHFIEQLYLWCLDHDVEYVTLFREATVDEGHDLALYPNALQKWKDTFCTLPHPW